MSGRSIYETAEDIAEAIFSAVSAVTGTSLGFRGPLKDVERPSSEFETIDGDVSMIESEVGKQPFLIP